MNMTLDELLRSRKFNQRFGKVLLEMAEECKRKAYEEITDAGYKKALEKMENWESNDLPIVYTRNFLEEMIDVDVTAQHIDDMDEDEFDKWCDRNDEYMADRNKALIPRKGYQKWFINKWFSEVRF